jgi:hypothetical protein
VIVTGRNDDDIRFPRFAAGAKEGRFDAFEQQY